MFIDDTIAAIATAPGEGGIGIVRISGQKALKVADEIFRSMSGKTISEYKTRTLIYGNIVDGEDVIDEVLLAYMKGPNSYTAEDVIEINCHGGFISVKKILELILSKDVRIAEPGEFTKRAFLNGRIDLSQAEAIIDVIKAKTDMAHQVAQNQLEGSLSSKIKELRGKVTEVLAHLEVAIDFSEEDIEEITYQTLKEKAEEIRIEIKKLYDTAESGKILRDGLKTVIVGKPNVGKSSLLNSILGENRAIVTDIPGTTRDVIEEFVNIKGIPLKIVDTAGIRETEDVVEKIGVEKSRESFNSADLVIMVLDSSRNLSDEDIEILENLENKKTIVILNKTDLEPKIEEDVLAKYVKEENIIRTSALKHEGIEELYDKIESMVYKGSVKNSSSLVITNSRHKDALLKSYESINDAINAIDTFLPYDFIEVDFKNIWDYLGYINGDTVKEDLLDTIFSNFCIGK
ncbi:tRNA uridine-5-carboxymethylaminomethyl(34) synthesis GTPase MnmE [Romboutsia sp. 1001216sp1]|uniref:tRNA uridine-5-carboxymethylaminomethyl(34) synthesis GTPase MnmE n=1 Tax=Romboutsia TaxID=1501226 RepID=UPI000A473FCE|nr:MULTISPECIES: tRNA uridine-5-carboxymethylaminomethyl(34) synthesis GTPase MnmE [unclassified Romboutsia]MDB8790801.1 tRNA uridine-5-carboxymethylaminomethyl(34) synthesis GTPase MnmE [Romboutsia sp. 1001216sp1]MDB8794027.1 tRNA uridine-5-carboxymethylaminomethyl(34) synthesis GTPase MnmE [Romboutsia sp. 1001216sp1]MDB8796954.1 tRNA uridine-5-carboxymethylaminomethyl(34) synthesis GTPase MnmE [Romboutsia sp. 1001216sp1]MDB8800409.1 tRNA uridine-5-carboxymethylaminomethyl(34) synthesis GTPase